MRLVSWNVNGLRACLGKGFLDFCRHGGRGRHLPAGDEDAARSRRPSTCRAITSYWNSADKAGYSGTAVFTRQEPLAVHLRLRHRRAPTTRAGSSPLEYPDFYLVCCYTPNSQDQLARLDYRMAWEDDFRAYLLELDGKKPVVLLRGPERGPPGDRPEKPRAPTAGTPASPTRSGRR